MSQEKFWVLLSKKLSGEASAEELVELEILISDNPGWQYAIQNIGDWWQQHPDADTTLAEDAYMLHLHRLSEMNISLDQSFPTPTIDKNKRPKRNWYWAAAAGIILAAGLFGFGKIFKSGSSNLVASSEINEITTRKGSKSEIKLPDGSLVWLNAGSKLTYTKEYGQLLREVTLTGEGYFDVVKMADKPFIIHTSNINIKVLGTAFNVKAYPEDKQTETSLIRGSIEVTIKNRPNNKIILSPDEKLVVENDLVQGSDPLKKEGKITPPVISVNKLNYHPQDSTVAETQWVFNRLVFNDESFAEVANMMERWYDVNIDLEDANLEKKRLTGNFEKETIEQALEALKLTIPFKYEQTDTKIIIHR